MMRSLFSGVSGLKSHQTRMDVIGNNIANVNTTGYKSKSLNFSDMLYQTTQAASGPNASTRTGGINPRQIGLGVKTAAINTSITTEGATQSTGNPFDLKLTGEAFFVVSDGTNTYYTRDGSFDVDEAGYLCMASTGYIVQGWGVDDEGNILKGSLGDLNVMSKSTYDPAATTSATVSKILDRNDSDLNTDTGKLMNIQVFDAAGYEYNVKLGIKNLVEPSNSTTKIVNNENEYTVPTDNIYLVDTSKLTFRDKTTEKVLQSSTLPAELIESLEEAVWAFVNNTSPAGVGKAGISKNNDAGAGTYTFGKESEKSVSIDMATWLNDPANADLKAKILNNGELSGMTLTVDFSGGKGLVASTASVISYPLSKDISAVSVPDEAINILYPNTTPDGKLGTALTGPITVIKQSYTDDNGDAKTDYKFKNGTADLTVPEGQWSNVVKLLGLWKKSDKQNTYTTTEQKSTTTPVKGSYVVSLEGMVDSEGKEVNIDAIKNNGTTSWNLVYNTDDGKFSYVGNAGETAFTVGLSALGGNFSDLSINMEDTVNQDNGGKSTLTGLKDNGRKVGTMSGVGIGTDGIITANYSNGMSRVLGQICVGTFANAMGLENAGDSLYSMTANSGDCVYEDIKASGIGYMTTGVLEMSNVDLSQEFTTMITTQRGFQANSRIITVSDTLLEELTNLKR